MHARPEPSRRAGASARAVVPVVLALSLSAAPRGGAEPARGAPTFTRILDAGPAVTDEVRLFGGSWADWNHDGHLDHYVVGEEIRAYPGDGAGAFGSQPGEFVSNPTSQWHTMGLWADWDEDGWLDLYVANFGTLLPDLTFVSPGADRLFRNAGPPGYELVPVQLSVDVTASVAPSWVDYDRDGDLDLCVSSARNTMDLFYRNDDGSFAKLVALPFLNARAEGAVSMWIDFDDDGDEDFYVVNHGTTNELYRSLLVETGEPDAFETVSTGPLVSDGTEFDITAEWCDYDNDGDLDAFVPVTNGRPDKLFRNEGGGVFTSVSEAMTGLGSSTFGAWGDFDNDGDADLYVSQISAGSAAPRVFRNEGMGTFTRLFSGLGSLLDAVPRPQAGQWGDYDDDGDLDLYVVTLTVNQDPTSPPAPCYLHRNEDDGVNAWLMVRCTGTVSNRSAIGARVRVVATIGGLRVRQLRLVWGSMAGNSEQPDSRLHFGLGDASVVDSVTVEWPSGIVQTLTAISPDQILDIVEAETVGTKEPVTIGAPSPRRVRVFPNPFRRAATIRWDTPIRGASIVRIFDAGGRAIRTLDGHDLSGGLEWDVRDTHGFPVPPGVYYVRLDGPGARASSVVTRAR